MMASSAGPAWRTIPIADGTPPVGFKRLGGDRESGAFAALVRFPEGWSRPHTGRYAVEEEVLVLEGELEMSGTTYRRGDYAFFPALYVRVRSKAPRGALVLAFFSGPADWSRIGENALPPDPVQAVPSDRIPARPTAVAHDSRTLREHAGGAALLVNGPLAARAPRHAHLELVSLPTEEWASVAPGDEIPRMAAPVFCQLRTARAAGSRVAAVLSDI